MITEYLTEQLLETFLIERFSNSTIIKQCQLHMETSSIASH
jgi:hypothetical protein